MSPSQVFLRLRCNLKREWKIAFLTCFVLGLLIHMPVLLSDIPNHDGLDSMYFSQNMITSGRWFLSVACGFSSYYTLPWLIGILGLSFLGVAAAALCELLEMRKTWAVMLGSGLLVAFPALSSTFAYVYTLDGYMMALMLAVLAVLFVKKHRLGFLPGAVCLAFSMGIYQGYLSFAMILSVFAIWMRFAEGASEDGRLKESASKESSFEAEESAESASKESPFEAEESAEGASKESPSEAGKSVEKRFAEESASRRRGKEKGGLFRRTLPEALHYLYMGVLGAALYFGILQLLLRIQGKELDHYQGIDGLNPGAASGKGFLSSLAEMYRDFAAFTLKGNVLFQNVFSLAAWILLALSAGAALLFLIRRRKYWKNPLLFVIIGLAALMLPFVTNIILLISPSVNYHLLMRYQWVLYAIGAVALVSGCGFGTGRGAWVEWAALLAAGTLVFCYSVTDNIAYSNLQKRYEKTYAYCVRLLDRIEQTEGYYPGIPIAMIGVVGDEQFPPTDITLPVTSNMIGMNGDVLLYRGDNYRIFMQHYLGATLNILPAEAMTDMYEDQEYVAMDSFPGPDSIRIIDGIMYIKTENVAR